MSASEFRYNKKRKHYAYLFKKVGQKFRCVLLTTKAQVIRIKKGKTIIANNVKLYRHPNPKKQGTFFVIVRVFEDDYFSFGEKQYIDWFFDKNDKRKIKRIKKKKQ